MKKTVIAATAGAVALTAFGLPATTAAAAEPTGLWRSPRMAAEPTGLWRSPRMAAEAPKPGSRSGLPFDSGVFAHSPERAKRYEEVTGRPVDVYQVAPQREEGFAVMLSELKRIQDYVPAGATMDIAIPLVSADEARQLAAAVAEKHPNAYWRPGWEFNLKGSWAWTTDRIGDEAFVAGFKASVDGIRAASPGARITWNPNSGQGGWAKAQAAYPGDEYVDVIGVDAYKWSNEDFFDGVGGVNDWAKIAREKGKKLSFPEWGVHGGQDGTGDDAAFVTAFVAWMVKNRDVVVMASYFDETSGYIANSVADGQMPKSGQALKAAFDKASGVSPVPGPSPSASPVPSPSPSESPVPGPSPSESSTPIAETKVKEGAGEYHLWAPAGAKGLVVYLDGDGMYGHDNPNSSHALGGDKGIVKVAEAKGYAALSIRTTDPGGTFWRNGAENAEYVAGVVGKVKARLGVDDVRLVGFSGGSQLITKFLLPAHPGIANGAVIIGGGGAGGAVPEARAGVELVWHTGTGDDGSSSSDGYDAFSDAKSGEAAYKAAGWSTRLEAPEGVDHEGLSGTFGTILDSTLSSPPAVADPTVLWRVLVEVSDGLVTITRPDGTVESFPIITKAQAQPAPAEDQKQEDSPAPAEDQTQEDSPAPAEDQKQEDSPAQRSAEASVK